MSLNDLVLAASSTPSPASTPTPSAWASLVLLLGPAGRPGGLRRRARAQLSVRHAPPCRGDGRHLRPHPPRPPRGRLRGAGVVRPRRGRLRADRRALAEGRPRRLRRRAPLPDDGDRHRCEPAVQGLAGRHRPRRADVHHRHAARPAAPTHARRRALLHHRRRRAGRHLHLARRRRAVRAGQLRRLHPARLQMDAADARPSRPSG